MAIDEYIYLPAAAIVLIIIMRLYKRAVVYF